MRKIVSSTQTPSIVPDSIAVVIGRFQLFHNGHETVLKTALATAEKVIVVIGSAYKARDARNPFTADERKAMILAALSPAMHTRVSFLPVRNYFDDVRWNSAVEAGVRELTGGARRPITLVGVKKDSTSYYLDSFPSWKCVSVVQEVETEATALRDVFFEGKDPDARLAVLAPYVSAGVLQYLQSWARLPVYAERVREHKAVKEYRDKWGVGPFLTADAMVVARPGGVPHVLLIKRGQGTVRAPTIGAGLFALPGGFVEPGERFYPAALRELDEETGFKPLASSMKAALRGSQVFDHPSRSPRGRLITNAFYFNFGSMELPEVQGADDAAEARWVAVSELGAYEDKLLDDHACILRHFLGVAWA